MLTFLLSRRELYSRDVNRAALQLIMMQIENRQTYHLRKGIQRWPIVELGIFLSQLINTSMLGYEKWYYLVIRCLSSQTADGAFVRYESLFSEKRGATSGDGNDLIPMIDFIALVVDHDHLACQAAFDGGFLDMLLRIYILLPTLGQQDTSALVSACMSALLLLSRQPEHLYAIFHHPVCTLWVTCSQVFKMPELLDAPGPNRCAAWRRTEKSSVISRLVIIHKILLSKSRLENAATTDMCNDLIEFSRSVSLSRGMLNWDSMYTSRSSFYDAEVIELAILAVFRYMVIGGDRTRHLACVLASASHQDVVNIFSRIARLWVAYIQIRDRPEMALQLQAGNTDHSGVDRKTRVAGVAGNESIYDREKSLLFRKIETIQQRASPLDDRPLHNILEFAMTVAKNSLNSRWGVLDAGILALVPLAVVDGISSLLSPLLDMLGQHIDGDARYLSQQSHPSGIEIIAHNTIPPAFPLALVGTATSKLLSLIKDPQFDEFLHSKMFITRRNICSCLLDTLLGDGHGLDDAYSKIRDLFAQILAERDIRECLPLPI